MTYSLTLNKYVFGTYCVPLWMCLVLTVCHCGCVWYLLCAIVDMFDTYCVTIVDVFGTYCVPLWVPGTEQLRTADNRVIIATLLALCHSTQKTGKIIIQIHL